ncbi:hypothetical protein AVEN_224354-1 [Araneus ventricosus]|uniref:Uncharacterized protein n=1 Tax=Araneus ventricosus TaxID=182803 RepID=A0A4Y2VL25_ARAVE|nr:hypothetical protein AVEN_224354-1 [Araneus ventricosus]
MAQRGQERRAEETEEQRNRRLVVKGQRSQHIRAEETEEQRKDNTFWGERNSELFWEEPRYYEPWSDDECDTSAGAPLRITPAGRDLATMYDLA